MEQELKGRVAVITGAGSLRGIGIATAQAFARESATVVLTDIDPSGLRHNLGLLEEMDCKAIQVVADVSSKPEVDRLFRTVSEEYGRVDILVNNAGITQSVLTEIMTETDWDRMLQDQPPQPVPLLSGGPYLK